MLTAKPGPPSRKFTTWPNPPWVSPHLATAQWEDYTPPDLTVVIPDPSFEDPFLPDWTVYGSSGTGLVNTGHTGTRSLTMPNVVTVGSGRRTAAPFSVIPGVTYTLGMWVRASTGTLPASAVRFQIRWGTTTNIANATQVVLPGGSPAGIGNVTWVQFTTTWTAPSTAAYAWIEIARGEGATGTAYVDDITMTVSGAVDERIIGYPGLRPDTVALIWNTLERIPLAIRQGLAGQPSDPAGGEYLTGELRMFLGRSLGELRAQAVDNPGTGWAGYYVTPVYSGRQYPNSFFGVIGSSYLVDGIDTLLLHEYGHHVDFTTPQLMFGTPEPAGIAGTPAMRALWDASHPTIPPELYGDTNASEWFAELWTCQMIPPTMIYRNRTAAQHFLDLAGGDQDRADAIRHEFTVHLPMPAWNGYPALGPIPTPPTIFTQPEDQIGGRFDSFSLECEAGGTFPISYQWQIKPPGFPGFSDVPGANKSSLGIGFLNPDSDNGRQYRCRVVGAEGTVISNIATMTVLSDDAPVITQHPAASTIMAGGTFSWSSAAEANIEPLTLQWQGRLKSNGTWADIAGETSSPMTLTEAEFAPYDQVRAMWTNPEGTRPSRTAGGTVAVEPVITQQPVNRSGPVGNQVIFAVGRTPIEARVRWERSINGGSVWSTVQGPGEQANYVLVIEAGMNGHQYRAVVTNSIWTVVSDVATLTVT